MEGFRGFFTPKCNNFVETFECHYRLCSRASLKWSKCINYCMLLACGWIFCFSVLCALHSEDSSDTKIGRPSPPPFQKQKLIICQTTKSGKFVKPQKKLSNLQTQKKDLAKFQNQKNIERASLSNFERWPLGQITCSALIQLAKRFLASWIFLHDSAQTPLTYNKEL